MILHSLSVINFKNISAASCQFAPKLNCFFGGNGMGKTNLLDAIHYLSMVRGHLQTSDRLSIQYDAAEAIIQGEYHWLDGQEDKISLKIPRERGKQLSRNGRLYQRHSDHIGRYPLVIISPQDQRLIRGGSEERRRTVDRILSQQDATYLSSLISYNRALEQRNNLLRQHMSDPTLFDALEEILTTTAMTISAIRTEYIQTVSETFHAIYSYLCRGQEQPVLRYTPTTADTVEEQMEQLRLSRVRDLQVGFTTLGIHREDFDMLLGDHLMRKVGSEGQNKTYLLAFKLAEYRYLQEHLTHRVSPLLLLDDIFDRLDNERVDRIIELVSQDTFGQIFITDTNRKYLDEIILSKQVPYSLFEVQGGEPRTIEMPRDEA